MEHLEQVCHFIVKTKKRGFTIKPDNPGSWDGTRDYEFIILGECDSNFAKDPTGRSVGSGCTFLCGAVVKIFLKMIPIMVLSTTKSELYDAVLEAIDMVFAYHIMKGMDLTVKLTMILYCNNKGVVDLANNWSVGGRTRHMGVKQNYLCELKELGYLHIKKKQNDKIIPDIGTKNTAQKLFEKQTKKFMTEPKQK